MNAQNNPATHLDVKQKSIVAISAFTAIGNIDQLKPALNDGLDAGLTINQIKEVLVQMYAYCGFPRSLNGITAFMAVLDNRKAKGKKDIEGKDATPIAVGKDKYQIGRQTLEVLTKKAEVGPKTGANAFAPVIDTFLKEHLFADIFGRDILTYEQRELATITVLSTLTGMSAQLQAHLGMGMNIGITEGQLADLFAIIEEKISAQQAAIARQTLANVIAARKAQ